MSDIEIVEPSDEQPVEIVELKPYSKVLAWCDCTCGDPCPQGKTGSSVRCRVWVERKHLSAAGIAEIKRMNVNNR